MNNKQELAVLLARHLAAGKLDAQKAVPLLNELLEDEQRLLSQAQLMELLGRVGSPCAEDLRESLFRELLHQAATLHDRRITGAAISSDQFPDFADFPCPMLGWADETELLRTVSAVLSVLFDLRFLENRTEPLPMIRAAVLKQMQTICERFRLIPERWNYLFPDVSDVPDELHHAINIWQAERVRRIVAAFDAAPSPAPEDVDEITFWSMLSEAHLNANHVRRMALLDMALCRKTADVAMHLPSLCHEAWERERAMLVLMQRFGRQQAQVWADWEHWFILQTEQRKRTLAKYDFLTKSNRDHLLCLWYEEQDVTDCDLLENLAARSRAATTPVTPQDFVRRWHDEMPESECNVLLGLETLPRVLMPDAEGALLPVDHERPVVSENAPTEIPVSALTDSKSTSVPHKAPSSPSLWNDHISPFLAENWYLVVGLAMVLVGSSLLAYFTWDKHWLLRYTIMPLTLAAFTLALAEGGSWLERKFAELRTTGIMMRGASILLLPVNFMVVALASLDDDVTQKTVTVAAMGVVYLLLFGWATRRWCRGVHASLAGLLGYTLVALNAMVILVPASALAADGSDGPARLISEGGFHVGFAVALGVLALFLRRVLTLDILRERLVPWFFVSALAFTFLEVFIWVHSALHYAPVASHYALMAILAGGAVIFMERRCFQLRGGEAMPGYGGESFLGYALMMLGVFMAMSSPGMRIAALLLAGMCWLFQASLRQGALQYWIGLTLLFLGGASVGLLDSFPKNAELNALPFLGLTLAAGFRLLLAGARHTLRERLAAATRGFIPGVLFLTAVVSILSQWEFRSDPLMIAATLTIIGVCLGVFAERDNRLPLAHTALALFALALSYFGLADMRGMFLHGNNMVFGLATLGVVWLVFLRIRPRSPWLAARSTVLVSLGVYALGAMLLRVLIEQPALDGMVGWRELLDVMGPFVMAVVLGFAVYHSRSLLPAILAAVITAVLFPELKETIRHQIPGLTWGSGLASSVAALIMIFSCYLLRGWTRLRALAGGDLLFGEVSFPWKRHDHTLFTWPLLASALFLIIKVDTINFFRNVTHSGLLLKTTIALVVSSVAWLFSAGWLRRSDFGKMSVLFSSITALAAFWFFNVRYVDHPQNQIPFLALGVMLQGLAWLYALLEHRRPWICETLGLPTRRLLVNGSWLMSLVVTAELVYGVEIERVIWLGAFCVLQTAWNGLGLKPACRQGWALCLLLMTGLAAYVCPGTGWLGVRITSDVVTPMLFFALAIHGIHLVLELIPSRISHARGLLVPLYVGTCILIVIGMFFSFWQLLVISPIKLTTAQLFLVPILLILSARRQHAGEFFMLALVLIYVSIHISLLRSIGCFNRMELLLMPWRVAIMGAVFVLIAEIGARVGHAFPLFLTTRHPVGISGTSGRSCLFGVAMLASCFATAYTLFEGDFRHDAAQLFSPYIAFVTLLALHFLWRKTVCALLGGLSLSIGNCLLVHHIFGPTLFAWGLSDIHVVCLGLTLTMAQVALLRMPLRGTEMGHQLHRSGVALAGVVLTLLSMHYFSNPNLAEVTVERFAISGTMALLAGFYFRWAARMEAPSSARDLFEAVYHLGIAISIWCYALMLPMLREPNTVLFALGLPPIWFYIRAEHGFALGSDTLRGIARRYRNSATILSFILLATYVLRGVFQMILFPEKALSSGHYHINSYVALTAGMLLLRLHGLGATSWSAFYGGLSLAVGAYFAVTSFEGLSPFGYSVPAAWVAVLTAHFFLAVWAQRSPLRTTLQELAGADHNTWRHLRLAWGHCIIWGAIVPVFLGLRDYQLEPKAFAPLMLGAATLFIHQGLLAGWRSYMVIAAAIFGLALHADFAVESYLSKEYVVWVVIGIWSCITAGDSWLRRVLSRQGLVDLATLLMAIVLVHILYHRPWSGTGLLAMVFAGVLWALVCRDGRRVTSLSQRLDAAFFLVWIPWLTYFISVWGAGHGAWSMLSIWPILMGLTGIFVSGTLVCLCSTRWATMIGMWEPIRPRLFVQALDWFMQEGRRIHLVMLSLATTGGVLLLVTYYNQPFFTRELVLFAFLWIGMATTWFVVGRMTPAYLPHVMAELCVVSLLAFLRQQLMLAVEWWTPHYDIWVGLSGTAALAGAKSWIDRQETHLRYSLVGTMLALPVVAILWTVTRNLGTDIALVVIGLNSAIFAYLGKGTRSSKYNIVAIIGFMAFVILFFWQRLHLSFAQAYVLPVGLGLLMLLHMFGKDMPSTTRNRIRLTILAVMFSCTGYYSLLDLSYPLWFHLTMLIAGLTSMLAGSLLRVRVYLALGGVAVLVDLCVLFGRMVANMDRTYQMSIIGLLLLFLGVAVVGGAAYYKTQRARIDEWLDRQRGRFSIWE